MPQIPATPAAYDAIADWYETEFLAAQAETDPIGVTAAIRTLLGPAHANPPGPEPATLLGPAPANLPEPPPANPPGPAPANPPGPAPANLPGLAPANLPEPPPAPDAGPLCLEVGCGTGVHAATVRALGWTPVGVDLSAGMLAHAADRLPTARADAEHLPIGAERLAAVITVMVHTDMPGYAQVVAEAARILRPGGTFVHVGVHPCFCGGFADRTDPAATVIRPGYLDAGRWTKDSWTSAGVRDKVGATHWPLPDLLRMVTDAGLVLERFAEGGTPTPTTFSMRARKPER